MSRSHHNAYSQQQHHHTPQNSWFMSPNIVNSLFCSPGNNSSGSCNSTFLNGSNINNHLTSLLNTPHHFMPSNQLSSNHSNSQSLIIGGNAFSSHYHPNHQSFTSQPYSSMFPLNNTYSNSSTGSNNRFVAGQNNHHYQSSSNYSRSMHSNRPSRTNMNFNQVNSEANHARRYQPGCNSNGPLLTFPGSVANNKSLNMNVDFNVFNDNYGRPLSSNPSFYANKDSKTPNINNNFNSNVKYNAWSKSTHNDSEGASSSNHSGSDLHQHSKINSKNQPVRGMENIKLDNEGVHSNYIQFTGMISKPLHDGAPNCETPTDSSPNQKDNSDRMNNYSNKPNANHHSSGEFHQLQPTNTTDISNSASLKKNAESDCRDNQKKSSMKFLLNVDEDELVYYDDDIVEIARFESENNNESLTSLSDDVCTTSSVELVVRLIADKEGSPCEGNKKKKLSSKNNSLDSVNSINVPYCTGSVQTTSFSNMEFVNSEASSLLPTIAPPNIPAYSSQLVANFPMNYPLVSNAGGHMMSAAYIAAALTGNHPSMLSNPNAKCGIFRNDNIALNANSYHEIVSGKLWQYYITNRQTEAMYVRKVQLRNALHMVMSYVFENAGLFIVGSSMNGFGNDHSDMDLCLTITSKELHQKKEAFVVLNQLVEPLRKCSFIKNLQLIRATVPILKFRDALAGVDCDLNINNVVGIYNTHLLAMYNRIDWRVRPLGMYIKHWAQKLDLHDASRGRISTYTLILMIIQYFQAGCQPPVLPSLQAKFPKHFSYDRQVKEVDMRLELPWEELRSTNTTRLSDLLLGFFEYYVEKFDFSKMAVSIRTGKPIPIEMAIKQLPPHEQLHNVKSFKMFIEEPFSMTNVARSLFDGLVFSRIKRCFRHSLQVMRTKQSLKYMFILPTPSNAIGIDNPTTTPENPDQNRMVINPSPSTSNSTQDENSKTVPISDNIDNDMSEKFDFKDDTSLYSDDNKSVDKNRIIHDDFEEDESEHLRDQ